MQTLASQGLFGKVGRPANGPQVDVVQLAASVRAPVLVTLSVLKELTLAMTHFRRNGAVISHGDESQLSQNGGDRHYVGDCLWLRLIEFLCSALTCLPPSRGVVPVDQKSLVQFDVLDLLMPRQVCIEQINTSKRQLVYPKIPQFAQNLHSVYIANNQGISPGITRVVI
jgi:hypothetical protein